MNDKPLPFIQKDDYPEALFQYDQMTTGRQRSRIYRDAVRRGTLPAEPDVRAALVRYAAAVTLPEEQPRCNGGRIRRWLREDAPLSIGGAMASAEARLVRAVRAIVDEPGRSATSE